MKNKIYIIKYVIEVLIIAFILLAVSYASNEAKSPDEAPPDEQSTTSVNKENISAADNSNKRKFAPDEIIVKLNPEAYGRILITTDSENSVITGRTSLDVLNKRHGVVEMGKIIKKNRAHGKRTPQKPKRVKTTKAERLRRGLLRLFKMKLKKGTDVLKTVSEYQNDPNVEYAEPNYILYGDSTFPDDPAFVQQSLWGLHNVGQNGGVVDADIDAPEAWDIGRGSRRVVVAVIDTGVQYTHPDLAANMWTNPGYPLANPQMPAEIPGNGIDDDGNGYVDDVYGINAISGSGNPMDDHGHGTHISGTIGGVGNNDTGIVGVNWEVSIMALKFIGSYNWGWYSDAVECVYYAIDKKAHVMSNSWGGTFRGQALEEAVNAAEAAGIIFVASAANNGSNNDASPVYPASYEAGNVIAVAATNRSDRLANFSNYGPVSVDVAAPGVSIYSTMLGNSYASWSGTSMATPHVAGLAALIWSIYGVDHLDYMEVKNAILQTVDLPDESLGERLGLLTLRGKILTEGRINAYNAVMEIVRPRVYSITSAYGEGYGLLNENVTISGDNFGDDQGSSVVRFHSVTSPNFGIATVIPQGWSNTLINCTVPADALTGYVTVTTAEGASRGKLFGVYDSIDTYYRDADRDGYGTPDETIQDCYQSEGYVTNADDCDDADPFRYLGATEYCNGRDNDCDDVEDNNNCESCTYYVPSNDYSTIQEAIDAIPTGCEVMVADGIYAENINFSGKAITVRSINGPHFTTIDGNQNGSVVSFNSGEDGNSVLDGFTVIDGSAADGGGVYCESSSPSITNCIISGNSAENGGGVYCYNSSPIITNCIISGNAINGGCGAGIFCFDSSPKIIHCTISGNNIKSYGCYGGGIYCKSSSSPIIVNSVLWGDRGAGGSTDEIYYFDIDSVPDVTYSNVEGGWTGNIEIDPLFLNPRPAAEAPTVAGDYHLRSGSPCIDVGAGVADLPQETGNLLPASDIYNDSRPYGAGYDMGADEYIVDPNCTDADSDGYFAEVGCGWIMDCNDNDANINPLALEVCDGLDNDCNPNTGDGFDESWYGDDCDGPDTDQCMEGVYVCLGGSRSCTDSTSNNQEVCDLVDNDCDGLVDENAVWNTFYYDYDADGYGNPNNTTQSCLAPDGYVGAGTDCDDFAVLVNPGAMEICGNNVDDDCDGTVDESQCQVCQIFVPGDFTTIQGAIDAAYPDGCIINVGSGVYPENIDFLGKPVTVRSESGASLTEITGAANDSVVTFDSGETASSVLDGFTITGGSTLSGGGVYCSTSAPTIINCIIKGNLAYRDGGGIYCQNSSSPTITNCIISGNSAGWNGGGFFISDSSSPVITNCTVSGNFAGRYAGGLYCGDSSSPTFINCILWNDGANLGSNPEIYPDSATLNITYSDVDWAGAGNINIDPEFVNQINPGPLPNANGDYHLQSDSPCIDAGFADGAPDNDIDSDLRPMDAGYDMGADERRFYRSSAVTCTDTDGDGFFAEGDCDTQVDCNDMDDSVYPGAAKVCNGEDNDCDGEMDENMVSSCGGSDVGECRSATKRCVGEEWTGCTGAIGPANEKCDGKDNNCDGDTDEGYTNLGAACDGPDSDDCNEGYNVCKANGSGVECSDNTDDIVEVCDGYDNDCDGDVDETFVDTDSDDRVDCLDNCINIPNYDQSDLDADGVGDVCDSCPFEYNPYVSGDSEPKLLSVGAASNDDGGCGLAGVVAHWKFDEESGYVVFDKTGNANDGTIYGAGWTTGRLDGGALRFDGNDDLVDCGRDPSLNFGIGDFSVCAWIKPSTGGRQVILDRKSANSQYPGYQLYMGSQGEVRFGLLKGNVTDPDNYMEAASLVTVNDSTWHFVCGVADRELGISHVYVDGQRNGSNYIAGYPGSFDAADTDLFIGADQAQQNPFNGLIGEVIIYKRAMSAAEVSDHFTIAGGSLDKTAPAFSGLLSAIDARTGGAAYIFWSSGTDSTPPVNYKIYTAAVSGGQDFTNPHAVTSATSYQVTGLNNGVDYYFVVRAEDAFGNEDTNKVELPVTPTAAISVPYDTTAFWLFDEESGNMVFDATGNNNAGIIKGAVRTAGFSGNALRFDGSDDLVDCGDRDIWDFGSNDFSLELWAKFDAIQDSGLLRNYSGGGKGWGFYYFTDNGLVFTIGAGDMHRSFHPMRETWYHFVFTREGNTGKIFANGTQRGNDGDLSSWDFLPSTNSLSIGSGFDGVIDKVAVYSRALTVSEVRDRFIDAGKSIYTTPPVFSGIESVADAQTNGAVLLSWSPVTDSGTSISYNIYYAATSGGQDFASPHAVAGDSSYLMRGLENDRIYYFVVRAEDVLGNQDTNTVELSAIPRNSLAIPSDAVAYWRFDEGTGDIAFDATVNAYNGIINGAAWSGGIFGGALSFEGSGDYVDCGNKSAWDFGSHDFSVELWVKFNELQNCALMHNYSGGGVGWSLYYFNDMGLIFTIGSSDMIRSFTPTVGTWYHIAFTRKGNAGKIFVNGERIQNDEDLGSWNFIPSTGPLRIGSSVDGLIDEVVIYNRALSAVDIQARYTRGGEQ